MITVAVALVTATTTATAEAVRTADLLGTGFTIDYPAGWHVAGKVLRNADTIDSAVTILAAASTDVDLRRTPRYMRVVFDHFPMLATKPYVAHARHVTTRSLSLEELVQFFQMFYLWDTVEQIQRTTLFGVPALAVQVRVDGRPRIHIIGNAEFAALGAGAFNLTLEAPEDTALHRFLPTWYSMLDSVRSARGQVSRGERRSPTDGLQ